MSELKVDYLSQPVNIGELGVHFMGQAGFLFKTPDGKRIALDPYLSNCCERYFGFKRLLPYLLDPADIIFDLLLTSHAHFDHFDVDSVPVMMQNKKTELIAALDCEKECKRLRIEKNITYMKLGDRIERDGVSIEGVPCDHGEHTPFALGFLIEAEGKKIYYMGDTCFRADFLEDKRLHGADLLILPINGAFGNLNEEQAARVCSILKPKLAVPCHYWNFAEHGGNPALFMKYMSEVAPDVKYDLMRPGEGMVI